VFQLRGDGRLFTQSLHVEFEGKIEDSTMSTLTLLSGGITIDAGGLVVR
jgi:hypothetical protein